MNSDLIKLKYNSKSLVKTYLVCLLLVLSFGIYKNIFNLIDQGVSYAFLLSKLLYVIIPVMIGLFFDSFSKKKINFGYNSLIGLIVGMIVPFNMNWIVYIISLIPMILLGFLDKKNKLNRICIIKLIGVSILLIIGKYNYLNILESSYEYAYSLVDVFVGNQVGGIFSTSVLLILVSLLLLSFNKIYKVKIAIFSLITYILILSLLLFTKDYMNIFMMMLNSSNIFAFVFIAPFSMYSPYKNKLVIIYSIVIGVLSALLTYFVTPYEGAIISILFANIFMLLLEKFHISTNKLK